MSAPNTNLETETKRHRPALIGIAVAIGFVAILFAVWLFFILTPESASVEGVTNEGEVEQAAPVDPPSENDGDALLDE